LRNCLLPCGQPRRTLAFCVGLLAGQFLCRGSRCCADFRFHGFASYACHALGWRLHVDAAIRRGFFRDYVLRFR
jgi:hypothetical protein